MYELFRDTFETLLAYHWSVQRTNYYVISRFCFEINILESSPPNESGLIWSNITAGGLSK